jgi:DNA-binding response OmpR family regulator/DnaJ-domain-containing protein 1
MVYRILVVDDEESVRNLVRDALEPQGFRVVAVPDYAQALKALKDQAIQAALIDFLLPQKNGFALAESIRKGSDAPRLPLLMMSGVFKNPKTAVEAREKYQVVEFLSKPLQMDALVGILRRALRGVPEVEDDGGGLGASRSSGPAPARSAPPSRSPASRAASESLELELSDSGPAVPMTTAATSAAAPPPVGGESPRRGLSFGAARGSGAPGVRDASVPPAGRRGAPEDTIDPRALDDDFGAGDGGRALPAMPEAGDLETTPVALLISITRYDELTGMLDLSLDGVHRRVYLLRGHPVFMQSNGDGENVGALLLRRGRITELDYERCVEYMKVKRRTLQQALLELRLATEHDLATAYKLLAGQLLPSAIGMPQGTFKWRETDAFVGRVPEGNFEPLSVLFEGIKRHVHPPQILKFFKGREDIPLRRSAEYETILPFFRRAFSASNVANLIDGRNTYRDITRAKSAESAQVVPQMFALVTSGMVELPSIDGGNDLEVAVNSAAAAVQGISRAESFEVSHGFSGGGGGGTAEDDRARAKVARGYDALMAKTFFEIFGVKAAAEVDLDVLKAAYLKLAKEWHNDAFAGLDLGPTQRQLDELFSRVTEGYETLRDPSKRKEYLTYLDMKAKGLPTDVNQILHAEQLCDEGIALLRRRDHKRAIQTFREAFSLNPSQAIYLAYLGWSYFVDNPASQPAVNEAVNTLKKAVGMQGNLALGYQFLGQIALQREQHDEARRWLQKCVELEPNNVEAQRGLRLVAQRSGGGGGGGEKGGSQRPSQGGSILSRFLSKKS